MDRSQIVAVVRPRRKGYAMRVAAAALTIGIIIIAGAHISASLGCVATSGCFLTPMTMS